MDGLIKPSDVPTALNNLFFCQICKVLAFFMIRHFLETIPKKCCMKGLIKLNDLPTALSNLSTGHVLMLQVPRTGPTRREKCLIMFHLISVRSYGDFGGIGLMLPLDPAIDLICRLNVSTPRWKKRSRKLQ